MRRQPKILHICSITSGSSGGVDVIVPQYITEQAKQTDVVVLNLCQHENPKLNGIKVYHECSILERILSDEKIDMVIFHEVYYFKYISLYKRLKSRNVPYIIIAHGSLRKEAQKQKHLAKVILNRLFFDSYVANAQYVQFLSEKEREASSGFNQKFRISPNGVHMPDVARDYSNIDDKDGMNLVFIGRYSIFYKGIDLLIEACASIKDEMRSKKISIDMYGVDFENNIAKIHELLREYQIEDLIGVNGPAYAKEKTEILLRADGFIQTSRSEGQPVGILEAMSYGLVPLVTEGTTFADEVIDKSCGFAAKTEVEAIAQMILDAESARDTFETKSQNARALISQKYEWTAITANCLNEYLKFLPDIAQ